MPTTLQNIIGLLQEADIIHERNEDDRILIPYGTQNFVDSEGEKRLVIVLKLEEDGELLRLLVPMALKAEGPYRHAVLRACMMIHWQTKLVKFEYDDSDGEIRPTIEIVIEDSTLTLGQLMRCLRSMIGLLEQSYPVLVRAAETGEVSFEPPPSEQSSLPEGKEGDRLQLEALRRRLEQLSRAKAAPERLAALRLEIEELEGSLAATAPPEEI